MKVTNHSTNISKSVLNYSYSLSLFEIYSLDLHAQRDASEHIA